MPIRRLAALAVAGLAWSSLPAAADVSLTTLGGHEYFIGSWSISGPNNCGGTVMVFYASGAFADIKLATGEVDDLGVWIIDGDRLVITAGEAHLPKDTEVGTVTVQNADQNHADITLTLSDGSTQTGSIDRCPAS